MTSRRQYDAWGNLELGADQPGYAFTGREWDPETGLYYYRARYYDPRIGRFISEDPIGFLGGWNFYAYVENQPTRFSDPSGLDHWLWGSGGILEKFWAASIAGLDTLRVRRITREVRDQADASPTSNTYGGSMDAFRHCLIGCRLTNAVGREKAIGLEAVHEFFNTVEGQTAAELKWDAYNYGQGNECAIAGTSAEHCYDTCLNLLVAGKLGGAAGIPTMFPDQQR